ncbi:MAG: Rieske 2Fe-2S domain-containing protein [Planctomycetota bacterium]|nr:Rieske 2Fe-2S domain-containing protein [Planctomycetota bacterium]
MVLKNIGPAENFPVGKGTCIEVEGKRYAVFNTTGQYYAIDDACPHAGGFFSDGNMTGTTAYCPLHGASVDVRTGVCGPPSAADVETYDVSCDSTDLFLHVD